MNVTPSGISIFKSITENYSKEQDGRKPNTIRKLEADDPRLPLLKPGRIIRMVRNESREFFERRITDVTLYGGWYIISWKHESEQHDCDCGRCDGTHWEPTP